MPAIAAHHFFGRSVRRRLSDEPSNRYVPSCQPMLEQAFAWGCQGPDILFYHLFPTGRQENFGALLHREKIPETFFYLTQTVRFLSRRFEARLLAAYLAGYVCHYCLDRQTHPYINFRCQAVSSAGHALPPAIQHRMLEADLERAYIQNYAPQTPVRFFRLDRLQAARHEVTYPIARLLAGLGRQLFQVNTNAAKIAESMRLMNHLQTLLYDPGGKKRGPYSRLEQLAGHPDFFTALIPPETPLPVDSVNQNHQPWRNVQGMLQYESYWELAREAESDAVSLIRALTPCLRPADRQSSPAFPGFYFTLDYLGNPLKK